MQNRQKLVCIQRDRCVYSHTQYLPNNTDYYVNRNGSDWDYYKRSDERKVAGIPDMDLMSPLCDVEDAFKK